MTAARSTVPLELAVDDTGTTLRMPLGSDYLTIDGGTWTIAGSTFNVQTDTLNWVNGAKTSSWTVSTTLSEWTHASWTLGVPIELASTSSLTVSDGAHTTSMGVTTGTDNLVWDCTDTLSFNREMLVLPVTATTNTITFQNGSVADTGQVTWSSNTNMSFAKLVQIMLPSVYPPLYSPETSSDIPHLLSVCDCERPCHRSRTVDFTFTSPTTRRLTTKPWSGE